MKVEDLSLVEVKEMMTRMLTSVADSLPHAWLFSGPRGTGKTSLARILAKSLNCTKKKGFEPCNECDMCETISAGTAMDVVEIDAASNRGIDEIRELKEKIKLAPMRAKSKVYIIDEVHMLTTEAANALLKTLEEPPENTYFVLCTTEPERLPETVVSRCTRINFRKPSLEEGVSSLQRVAKGEGMKADVAALETLVKAAKGSFRDGTKLLEQVWLSAGEVTEETVAGVLKMTTENDVIEFCQNLAEGKTPEALAIISGLEQKGINWRRFVESVVEVWRDELLNAAKQNGVDVVRLLTWIAEMDQVYEQMKTSVIPQLPLEMFVISKQKRTEKTVKKEPDNEGHPGPVTAPMAKKAEPFEEESRAKTTGDGKGKYTLQDLEGRWGEIMKLVRPKNHSVEALLRSTKPTAFDGEKLELDVFYKFHKDKLETEKCRTIVETAIGDAFNVKGIKMYLKLGTAQKKKEEEITAAGVGQDIVQAAEQIFGVEAV